MQIMYLSYRASRFLFFFFCHELIVVAYFFQFGYNIEPCPLCILQRICFALMAILFFTAALHNPSQKGKNYYDSLVLIPTFAGVGISAWHTWLQQLPADEIPTCGPGLNYLLDTLPLWDVFDQIFRGSGQCAEISWSFLGLSMPAWTLIIFTGFAAILITMLWKRFRRRKMDW